MGKTLKEKPLRRRPDSAKALEHLRKIRELSDRFGGPTKGMTKEEIIVSIKKTREELWDRYLASGSGL